MTPTRTQQSAFTLVELAIVLVIIALLIGGVLVGKDMIKAAGIRGAISDLEKINAAATTFHSKYGGLPGDLAASKAIEFALSGSGDANATGAVGLRDGNGTLEGGALGSTALAGENALFWKDLGASGLIGGNYNAIGTAVGPAASVNASNVRSYMPGSKLRDSASIYAYSLAGRNYYYIGTITATITAGVVTTAPAITSLEAKNMDEKLDDGAPSTGVVLARSDLATTQVGAAAASTVCVVSTTPTTYNVADTGTGALHNPVCQLQIRTAF